MCCNQKRAGFSGRFPLPARPLMAPPANHPVTQRQSPMVQSIRFEYVGDTSLSVTGPITRLQYRFRGKGARVEIDYRDAPYVTAVPNLRRAI